MSFSILVCIKSVPDWASGGKPTIDGPWIEEADLDWCMNPYDAHALEAALAIKDVQGHITIDVLSAGPNSVRPALRRAIAMGADAGIHLPMASKELLSSGTVARAIAHAVRGNPYDLILTGAVSEDLMQGTTGPMLAAALDRPCAAAVLELVLDLSGRSLEAVCELEGGMPEHIRLSLPALVTMQTGSRQPRYPSLSNTLRSRRQPIRQVTPEPVESCPTDCTPTGLMVPQPNRACEVIAGTPQTKADRLLEMFSEKGWLK